MADGARQERASGSESAVDAPGETETPWGSAPAGALDRSPRHGRPHDFVGFLARADEDSRAELILEMQRTRGNRAVTRLLASEPSRTQTGVPTRLSKQPRRRDAQSEEGADRILESP